MSTEYNLVETIKENTKYYTQRQIECAKAARKLVQSIGHPTIENLKKIITMNGIKNCPVTVGDITLAKNLVQI